MGVILFTVAIMPPKGSAFPQTHCPPSVSQESVLVPPPPARTRPLALGSRALAMTWVCTEEKLQKPLHQNTVWLATLRKG